MVIHMYCICSLQHGKVSRYLDVLREVAEDQRVGILSRIEPKRHIQSIDLRDTHRALNTE